MNGHDQARRVAPLVAWLLLALPAWGADEWDIGGRVASAVEHATDNQLKLHFEQRGRYEHRTGNGFLSNGEVDTGLVRTRLGLTYSPATWFKLSATAQDARAPWYGTGAPSSVRDQADLHEAYWELFPSRKTGFGMTIGRRMINYGETRLIGAPEWGNLARTYDHARVYWRGSKSRLEVLLISPVKPRIGEFNRPVLGDRVWGTYNVFPDFWRKSLLEVYVLRHDQNRPGGFTAGSGIDGTDRLGVNTFGFRMAGPFARGMKFSLEGALQNGKVGPAELRAGAWFAGLSRRWEFGARWFSLCGEYKYASGTDDPADPSRSGTFDQLYPANHDKFGHADLFGWRNIHNARSVATFGITKNFAVHFMYDSHWIASLRDGVYNGGGRLIARSPTGTAGRHVGQEADLFGTYRFQRYTFGAGFGHFFSGSFIRNTTAGVGPTYLYVFHTYSL